MNLLTEWEGRAGKYLARGHCIRTKRRSMMFHDRRAKHIPVRPDMRSLLRKSNVLTQIQVSDVDSHM